MILGCGSTEARTSKSGPKEAKAMARLMHFMKQLASVCLAVVKLTVIMLLIDLMHIHVKSLYNCDKLIGAADECTYIVWHHEKS